MFFRQNFSNFKKWPGKRQWSQFLKILSKKEKIAFFIFFALFLASSLFLSLNFYFKNSELKPKPGGSYKEGIIGQPRFINPVYANSDADRDLSELIFSGLMKYNSDMEIVPDLAQSYKIEEKGKVYKFYLKENIFWQDKTPLSADDIIFTIKTIQNPDYKSPFRANWIGVEVEKIGELGLKFTLKKPYHAFLENSTLKILPKHIWENISPEAFPFDSHNLEPLGSGPYKFKKNKRGKNGKIKSLVLKRNSFYHEKKPNISKIEFLFFDGEKDLIKAAKREKIQGFSPSSFGKLDKNQKNYYFSLPRYFAVFFNPKESSILSDKNIRIALAHGTDKKEVLKKALEAPESSLEKMVVNSPILPKIYNYDPPKEIREFNIEKAKSILEKAGFKDENQDGLREKIISEKSSFSFSRDLKIKSQGSEVRELQKCLAKFSDIYPEKEITGYFGEKTKEAVIRFQKKYAQDILKPWGFKKGTGLVSKTTRAKLNKVCFDAPNKTLPLKISLVTVDQPQLAKAAEELKRQWKILGVDLEIKKLPIIELEQNFIKPRKYEALLFGEVLGAIPDPLSFWHSSQKRDPGLNLALYQNKEADKLLEKIRISLDSKEIEENLVLFQNVLIKNTPALFLYSPDYIYSVSEKIKGIKAKKIVNPSKRFSEIENWYIKTRRVWK